MLSLFFYIKDYSVISPGSRQLLTKTKHHGNSFISEKQENVICIFFSLSYRLVYWFNRNNNNNKKNLFSQRNKHRDSTLSSRHSSFLEQMMYPSGRVCAVPCVCMAVPGIVCTVLTVKHCSVSLSQQTKRNHLMLATWLYSLLIALHVNNKIIMIMSWNQIMQIK